MRRRFGIIFIVASVAVAAVAVGGRSDDAIAPPDPEVFARAQARRLVAELVGGGEGCVAADVREGHIRREAIAALLRLARDERPGPAAATTRGYAVGLLRDMRATDAEVVQFLIDHLTTDFGGSADFEISPFSGFACARTLAHLGPGVSETLLHRLKEDASPKELWLIAQILYVAEGGQRNRECSRDRSAFEHHGVASDAEGSPGSRGTAASNGGHPTERPVGLIVAWRMG